MPWCQPPAAACLSPTFHPTLWVTRSHCTCHCNAGAAVDIYCLLETSLMSCQCEPVKSGAVKNVYNRQWDRVWNNKNKIQMSNVYLSLSPAPIIEMIDKLAKNWDKMWGEECGLLVIFCTSFQSVMGVMCFMYVCIIHMLSVMCNVLCVVCTMVSYVECNV